MKIRRGGTFLNKNGPETTNLALFHQSQNHHRGSGTKKIGGSDRKIKIGAIEVKSDTVADLFGRSSVEDNSGLEKNHKEGYKETLFYVRTYSN